MVTPGSADHLAAIRNHKAVVRCIYCNKHLVLGTLSIAAHEQFCPDRATVERQQERARERFKRKQAGFA